MKQTESPIRNISDTARWVAFYRALESERPDAHFHDPYARRLAGKRGEEIARTLPWGLNNAWALTVRTCVFDEIIMKTVEKRAVDTILSLAAGFDTRPYRLPLPATLHWIEVDLPELITEKEQLLANERSVCRLTRVPLDLADIEARKVVFSDLAQEAGPVLVITEGLLTYLTGEQVTALARDLRSHANFRWWLTDLISPFTLGLYRLCWGRELARANICWQFAPAEREHFFSHAGWHVAELRPTMEEAGRLHREMPFGPFGRSLFSRTYKVLQKSYQKMGCLLLLERD
jgi:methyltransferase (TIGR00027 family)